MRNEMPLKAPLKVGVGAAASRCDWFRIRIEQVCMLLKPALEDK
jgi:hypothetical protein